MASGRPNRFRFYARFVGISNGGSRGRRGTLLARTVLLRPGLILLIGRAVRLISGAVGLSVRTLAIPAVIAPFLGCITSRLSSLLIARLLWRWCRLSRLLSSGLPIFNRSCRFFFRTGNWLRSNRLGCFGFRCFNRFRWSRWCYSNRLRLNRSRLRLLHGFSNFRLGWSCCRYRRGRLWRSDRLRGTGTFNSRRGGRLRRDYLRLLRRRLRR